jgi:hypothetical protein
MILGFSGYLIFGQDIVLSIGGHYLQLDPSGLTIGLAYEKITKFIPLFVVLCVVSAGGRGLHPN